MQFDIRNYKAEHSDSIPVQDHGYSLVYVMQDGESICGKCVQNEWELIADSAKDVIEHATGNIKRDWHIVEVQSTMDYEPEDYPQCCHCHKTIGA